MLLGALYLNCYRKLLHQGPVTVGVILEFSLSHGSFIIWSQLTFENSLSFTHFPKSMVCKVCSLDLKQWHNLRVVGNAILKPTSDLLDQKL